LHRTASRAGRADRLVERPSDARVHALDVVNRGERGARVAEDDRQHEVERPLEARERLRRNRLYAATPAATSGCAS
jgi:hypothetical protein